ncbi:hypothetical protein ACSHT2_29280 [Bradyrhizobium sp. PUT101]|uniref:hypothetical protein n=1 Tax=Bradyrhizobium sp. PUT101 TaxID=3447427 RepID=UPI003F8273C4
MRSLRQVNVHRGRGGAYCADHPPEDMLIDRDNVLEAERRQMMHGVEIGILASARGGRGRQ